MGIRINPALNRTCVVGDRGGSQFKLTDYQKSVESDMEFLPRFRRGGSPLTLICTMSATLADLLAAIIDQTAVVEMQCSRQATIPTSIGYQCSMP